LAYQFFNLCKQSLPFLTKAPETGAFSQEGQKNRDTFLPMRKNIDRAR
jgi:hypothetical protein